MKNTSRILPFVKNPAVAQPAASAAAVRGSYGDQSFVLNGPSPAIAKLWSQIHRVAPYFRTALLTGEEGTGAEFVARALHDASPFRDMTLRVLSAAAAEIYFSPGGAFSHSAGHGAYFFEEIENFSSKAQQGLLHLLKARAPRATCVIAFASSDLRALVGSGRFSGELAATLGALRLTLPSLRERREDIPSLAQAIASASGECSGNPAPTLAPDFLEAIAAYDWPGNIDQMSNVIASLMRTRTRYSDTLHSEDFESVSKSHMQEQPEPQRVVRMVKLENMVQEHIRAVLQGCNGNKQKAAEVLGISRSTLYRMLDAGGSYLAQAS